MSGKPTERYFGELETVPVDADVVATNATKKPFATHLSAVGTVKPEHSTGTHKPNLMYVHEFTSGRAMTERDTSLNVVWGGKFKCDVFGARDLKGSRHENPQTNWIYYGGGWKFRVLGLYDEHDIQELIEFSDYMREHGLPTESPSRIYKLKELVIDGEPVDIDSWKKVEKTALLFMLDKDGKIELLSQARRYIDEAEFFEVERELQTSERVRDIAECRTEKEFKQVLGPVFKWINVATRSKECGILPGTPVPEEFDIENEAGIKRYLTEWLPSQMGTYLARMRKLKINNEFPHAQNWSLVATMYDLQNLEGEVFGRPCSEDDYYLALKTTLGVLEELLMPDADNFIFEKFGDLTTNAKASFIKSYLNELGKTVNEMGYAHFVDNSFYNGHAWSVRVMTPEQWVEILKLMGEDINKISMKKLNKLGDTLSSEIAESYRNKIKPL